MPKNQAEFSINELAQKANVTVRTIRFYINEGLLPAPQTRGRYTVYTAEYVDRLELIRRLKDSFLPLKEIRATLDSLSGDEVRATLDDLRRREALSRPAPPSPAQMEKARLMPNALPEPRSSALDYIANLLSSTPVSRPLPPPAAPPSPQPASQARRSEPPPETWQRLTLADGVELHFRKPSQPEDQRRLEELVRLARKLFSA